jgi:sigma-B regulation protein RsbU (phosphoserine phosphatase)
MREKTIYEQNKSQEKKPLILIVDDVPKNLQVLASILKSEGKYDISAATSASKALKIVDNVLPDLILLDIMMPDMDGFEVCQLLKSSEVTREIPIIYLTAKAGTRDIVTGFQAGAVDYVTKPFNGTELLARVQTHIELKKSREKLNDSLQKLRLANKEIWEKKKKIEEINRQLTDSINYAHLIQQGIMAKKQDVKLLFKESFIYFKPRDIVSGDFFWISETDTNYRVIIAAVDCTGHGVPGAFVSILSYQLMHDIIILRGIWEPDKILNELHIGIGSVFNQEKTQIYEGMEMALCSLDLQNRFLEFSGARNPLIYIYDNELYHVKGDRFPVGGLKKKDKRVFTKQYIPFGESTMFYIFTDGFPDQLGGNHERRFTLKQFKELLQNIHHLSMTEQEETLEKTLQDWMGSEYDQIDDILIIGFRL